MDRKAKGNRKEKEVMEIHKKQGYTCEKVRNVPYHHGDMFGCADLICSCRSRIKFVAVTDKSHKSRAVKALKSFKNHPKSLVKEVWLYKKDSVEWEVVDV